VIKKMTKKTSNPYGPNPDMSVVIRNATAKTENTYKYGALIEAVSDFIDNMNAQKYHNCRVVWQGHDSTEVLFFEKVLSYRIAENRLKSMCFWSGEKANFINTQNIISLIYNL